MRALSLACLICLAAGSPALAMSCSFKREQVSGMNKICIYSCVTGEAAITMSAVGLCPLTIER